MPKNIESHQVENRIFKPSASFSKKARIGSMAEYGSLRSERASQVTLLTAFNSAAHARSTLKLTPVVNHFAATAEGLGLAFLPVPFALAEGLVRVLPGETALLDLWLLRRRESDLRKMTKQVWRCLEADLTNSKAWFVGQKAAQKRLQRVA